ncbi:MAG: zinc dependent phospholipase C family protein [Candidatus Brocadiia bacterium]|jgi:hypothetical protein
MRHVLTGKAWRARTVALFLTVCVAAAAFGWGDETHRAVSRGAAVILPDEVRPFFLVNSDFIARHSTDPDYIPNRTAAQRAEHFLDIDTYGEPPFKDLPHDRAELEKKVGAATVVAHGLLPWTVNREFERLVKAFRERDWVETRMAAAYLSHFVADTTMPLHATHNYDGQLTGNNGIHRRIEVEMVARFHNVSMIAPSGITAVGDPVEWTFQQLERSLSFCPAFLKADTEARRAAPLDSEVYYLKLNEGAGEIVEARTRDAANAVAGFWLAAWQKAGRPALPPQREIVVLVVQSAPVAEESRASRHFHGLIYPASEIARIAAAATPFDAVTVAHAGVPYKAPRQSLHFIPALDAHGEAPPDWESDDLGRIGDAIHTISYSFEQFPGSQRVVILLCYGWKADESLPAAVAHLKAAHARCGVFTIGTFPEIPSVKQFAEDSGAAFHDLGDSEDIADLVAKGSAPLLAPVDDR